MTESGQDVDGFSPTRFLRARRPEKFSDTRIDEAAVLHRSILEFHLDSLTSRNQETEFERFCLGLARREVCPNLRPQTGPQGGGDSKVDSETYPVAPELAMVWHVGSPNKAATERWAFAFSAKKAWRPKLRSDVEKIAGTDRGYKRAYFFTNQAVPAKKRSELEDELATAHGLEVTIFDRTWIVDRVLEADHADLAVDELRLDVPTEARSQPGPRDAQREVEIVAAESRLEAAGQSGVIDREVAADGLEAALLARGLERPRVEIDQYFERAVRLAEQGGTDHQRILALYEWAWTTFWWFEDYGRFVQLYGRCEESLLPSRNPDHLDLLANLWMLLSASVARSFVNAEEVDLQEHRSALTTALESFSAEDDRLSSSLRARALLANVRLATDPGAAPEALTELKEVILESDGLVGFPFAKISGLLLEIGDLLEDDRVVDDIFELLADTVSRRQGEVSGARVHLKRGAHLLDQGRVYDAIRVLGKALGRLYKHETRHEVVRALYLCGAAYENAGLLWAARGALLSAASIATNEFWLSETVSRAQVACYGRLKWLELRLGRLPHLLAWHELEQVAKQALPSPEIAPEEEDLDRRFDAVLAILFLRADLPQLRRLTRFPTALDRLDLYFSAAALQFSLGQVQSLPDDLTDGRDGSALDDFFRSWREQPAAADISRELHLALERKVRLTGYILGCRLVVEAENTPPAVELGESVLAALQSFLSTGIKDIAASQPTLTISIRVSEFAERPFRFEDDESQALPAMKVWCAPFNPHNMDRLTQGLVKERVTELLVHIVVHYFMLRDQDEFLERLLRDERAVRRAVDFTGSFVTTGNILGHEPKLALSHWSMPDDPEEVCLRDREWDAADRPYDARAKDGALTPGVGDPPEELTEPEGLKHDQIRVANPIEEPLWNRAGWHGTLFITPPSPTIPILAPLFRDRSAAVAIFEKWRKQLVDNEADSLLRVSIIRGIHNSRPHGYRVVIGAEMGAVLKQQGVKLAIVGSRMCEMTPDSPVNLDRFLAAFAAAGEYQLLPAGMTAGGPDPLFHLGITKKVLHVREAWEIGRHDPDSVGVHPDDDPILPKDGSAPVLELIASRRDKAGKRSK